MKYSMIELKDIYGNTFSMNGCEIKDACVFRDSYMITPDGKFVTILTSEWENGYHYQIMKEYLEKYFALEKPILGTGDPFYFLKILNQLGIICTNLDQHTENSTRLFLLPPSEFLYRVTDRCKEATLLYYQKCFQNENPTYHVQAFSLEDSKIYASDEVIKTLSQKQIKK